MTEESAKGAIDEDVVHKVGGHIDWNESYYFNMYDREKDICVFMRMGLKPNRWEKNMYCYLLMPDGSSMGVKETVPYDGQELKAAGLKYKKGIAGKDWSLDYAGQMRKTVGNVVEKKNVALALRFEGINHVYDYALSRSEERQTFSLIAA